MIFTVQFEPIKSAKVGHLQLISRQYDGKYQFKTVKVFICRNQLDSVWIYKKRRDFLSTQALFTIFSRFISFQEKNKQFFPFFILKIYQNLVTVIHRGISYKNILSVHTSRLLKNKEQKKGSKLTRQFIEIPQGRRQRGA